MSCELVMCFTNFAIFVAGPKPRGAVGVAGPTPRAKDTPRVAVGLALATPRAASTPRGSSRGGQTRHYADGADFLPSA